MYILYRKFAFKELKTLDSLHHKRNNAFTIFKSIFTSGPEPFLVAFQLLNTPKFYKESFEE